MSSYTNPLFLGTLNHNSTFPLTWMLYEVSVRLGHAHVPQRLCFRQSGLLHHPLALLVLLVKLPAVDLKDPFKMVIS